MSEQYRFGEFLFDRAYGTLTRNGRPVRLQAQPALALGHLLANANRIVNREELRQVLWGTDTFVEYDKGLNFCIGQIRSALRDDAARPLYVRTIPKQGYEFIAPVRRVPAVEPQPPAPLPARPSSSRAILTGVAAGCLALVLAVSAYRGARKPNVPPNLAVVRFDADPNLPELQSFASNLTDNVVVELTAEGHDRYRIIGNAAMLRLPRDQRSLPLIASQLHCSYAVLGQVKSEGRQILILAHLIRLSDLTHIWVVRLGPMTMGSPLTLESQASRQIASEFSAKLADHPEKAASFGAPSN